MPATRDASSSGRSRRRDGEERDQPHGRRPAARPRWPRPADDCARSRRGARPAAPTRRSTAASPGSRGPNPWHERDRRRRSARRWRSRRRRRASRIGSTRSSNHAATAVLRQGREWAAGIDTEPAEFGHRRAAARASRRSAERAAGTWRSGSGTSGSSRRQAAARTLDPALPRRRPADPVPAPDLGGQHRERDEVGEIPDRARREAGRVEDGGRQPAGGGRDPHLAAARSAGPSRRGGPRASAGAPPRGCRGGCAITARLGVVRLRLLVGERRTKRS